MDWKRKLTSRKFWAAVVNFITQLMIAFNCGESAATQVAAVIMAGAGVIAYIVGEGLADAANAEKEVVHVIDDGEYENTVDLPDE